MRNPLMHMWQVSTAGHRLELLQRLVDGAAEGALLSDAAPELHDTDHCPGCGSSRFTVTTYTVTLAVSTSSFVAGRLEVDRAARGTPVTIGHATSCCTTPVSLSTDAHDPEPTSPHVRSI